MSGLRKKTTRRLRLQNETGSSLILVTLVSLVLAAVAIVALRNISRTVQQAAVYQTRQQSMLTSSGAASMFSKRVGDKASLVYNRMTQRIYQEETTDNDRGVLAGGRGMSDRMKQVRGGQYAVFDKGDFADFLPAGTETGLFTGKLADGSQRVESFEGQEGRTTTFRTIVRDPLDAQAATGFDNSYCFKKVVIATESTVGAVECDDNADCVAALGSTDFTCRGGDGLGGAKEGFCDDGWKRINTIAQSRSGMEGLIGPVECGY